jgi:hypothetical protein
MIVAVGIAGVATRASRGGCPRGTRFFIALLLKHSSKKSGSSSGIVIVLIRGHDCEKKGPKGEESQ